ncbi:MAG TPA: hypothetical protein ENK52_00805 [Saprospiraceae bacterium]|nr:hypothetical protein [Saprospiraceae bacterium]
MKEQHNKDFKKEIEQKKKRLKEEFGMDDYGTKSKMPPEIENQWLDQILAFEQQFKKNKQITVYEKIASPKFKSSEELDDLEIEKELKRLQDLMLENGINLDTICQVESRKLYEFITKELFEYEVDDIHIEGMTTNFIYEEFHPNHEYDLEQFTREGINNLFRADKEYWDMQILTDKFISKSGKPITKEKLQKSIFSFKDSYTKITLQDLNFTKIEYDLEKAKGQTSFYIKYIALPEKGEEIVFEGKGHFNFIFHYDYWLTNGMDMPGFSL